MHAKGVVLCERACFCLLVSAFYPAGRNYYTCNSKAIKSVSVSVVFFVVNSETIQECKRNGELQKCNGEL